MAEECLRRDIYVLDTNVLLYNPRAIFAFPGAEVVIPDQVLGELDRLKTARADKELRFRGREFARILFDLSESGKLTDGIPFGEDSILRVVAFNHQKVPDRLSAKNTDDRILSVVYLLQREMPDCHVTIVTNDLNMLVKAQMLDIPVTRSGEEFAYGPFRRSLVWLNSQKRALTIMAIILVAAAAIVFSQKILDPLSKQSQTPVWIQDRLQQYQIQENGYQTILDKNPKDLQALIGLGNIYFDRGTIYKEAKYYQKAIEYYQKALDIQPKNDDVRLDMATEYYNLNMQDVALKEFDKVLANQPNYATAHYYVGIILKNKGDFSGAVRHFNRYLEVAPLGTMAGQVATYLEEIKNMTGGR